MKKCSNSDRYLNLAFLFLFKFKYGSSNKVKHFELTILLPLVPSNFSFLDYKCASNAASPLISGRQRRHNFNSNLEYITCLVWLTHNQVIFFFLLYYWKAFQTSVSPGNK